MKKSFFLIMGSALCLTSLAAEKTETWPNLIGTDGKTWSVTYDNEMVNLGNEYYDDYRYKTVTVTVHNAEHQDLGSFTVDLGTSYANAIQLLPQVTQHLFNSDDQYEVALYVHIPGNASNGYTSTQKVLVYSLDNVKQMEVEGEGIIVSDGDNSSFILSHIIQNSRTNKSVFDIYQNAGDAAEVKYSYSVNNELLDYMNTPAFNSVKLSDGIHYIFSHFEKPMVQTDSNGEQMYDPNTWMPLWTPDNHFVVENYNQNFEKVDELMVSVECPAGIVSRMTGIFGFSDMDLTEGYFTGDGKYNYIIKHDDMAADWSYHYDIEVYSQGNEFVSTLCNNVGDYWQRLSSIEGEADQWIFLQTNAETGEQQLSLVELPSCNQVATIPAVIDGKLISTNLDRMVDEVEGYKYVIGLNEPDTDAENNVIAQYGIYHKDFTVDNYVCFNMGPNAEAFYPLIDYRTLDPHLFYNDDLHEFVFIAKIKGQDGRIYTKIFIGNENGEVLYTIDGEGNEKGDINSADIINYGTDKPEFFVSYSFDGYDASTCEFIALPLGSSNSIQQVKPSASDSVHYNLQGIRTSTNAPGLYLSNGQKIFKR